MADIREFDMQDAFYPSEILIVSDDPAIHGAILEGIKNQDITISVLRDGQLLAQKLLTRKPRLIMLDFNLPEMDGIAVCRKLQSCEDTQDIPVILMLASNDLDQRSAGFHSGAVDYLIKPLELAEVTTKLRFHVLPRKIAQQSVRIDEHGEIADSKSRNKAKHLCNSTDCEVCTELPLQERYFREIFYNAPELMCLIEVVADGDFKFLETNRALNTLMHARAGSMRGRKVADVFEGSGSVTSDKFIEILGRCSETQAVTEAEHPLIFPSGRFLVHSYLIPMFDTGGRVRHILATSREVSELKRAEQQISSMSYMFDQLHDSVYLVDSQFRIRYVNQSACKRLGYSREELLGMTVPDIDPIFDFEKNRGIIDKSQAPRFARFEACHRTKSGQIFPVEINTSAVNYEGEVMGLSVVLDITERKQMEATIRRREEEFRTLAENLPDIIVRYDMSFRRTYINKVYSKMLEPLGVDLLGQTPKEYWKVIEPNADEFTRILQQVIETGNPQATLIQSETRPGRMIYWTMNLVPEYDHNGRVNGVLSCATNITELKEYQREVEESRTRLRALAARSEKMLEDERKRIARELHDDLGQRLTALKLDLARLILRFGQGNTDLLQQVREMEQDMGATIQIVRDVATRLRPAALEMGIVSALEWLLQEFSKRTDVRCSLRISKPKLVLDDSQSTVLFRIVQESLTNVMRYARASKVEIALTCESQQYVLEISDDGVGFDADKKRKGGSFGLIGIEERALSLGGNIRIDTAPNQGFRLMVRIPIPHMNGERL